MRFLVTFLLVTLAVLFFSGCSDDVANEFAELYTNIAKIKCSKEFECCQTSTKPRHYETFEECVKYQEILSAGSVEYIEFSNYTWNKENAEKCLSYWKDFSQYSSLCDEDIYLKADQLSEEEQENISELESSCNSLIIEAAQLGDRCYPDTPKGDGCVEGLTCFKGTYTCEKTPLVGESCKTIDSCYTNEPDKEIYCDKEYQKDSEGNYETDTNGNHIIKSAVCKYAPVVGENCSEKECDKNLENVFCEIIYKTDSEGDYIYDEETGKKVIKSSLCKEYPKKGENCELSRHCFNESEGQLYCAREKNSEEETVYFCRAYPGVNKPCNDDNKCAQGLICKYESDNETSSYMCREKSDEGGTCIKTSECKDDLFCKIGEDAETGKCTLKYEGGSACLENAHCISGRCISNEGEISYCMGTTLADKICIPYDYNDDY